MLDALLMAKLFDAARREGLDLNDINIQKKLTDKKIQIEHFLIGIIEDQTRHCGCKGAKHEDRNRGS